MTVEKTTRIELEFSSSSYGASVVLTRKGRTEEETFEFSRTTEDRRDNGKLHFHFKGNREQLRELANFMARVITESQDELHPTKAPEEKR